MAFNPGYPNGQMPPNTLTPWGGNTVYEGMVPSLRGLNLRANQQGYILGIAPPVGGYRSLATQADMLTHPGNYGLNPNSNAPLAPIGHSTHGWGTAADLIGAPIKWLHNNAPDFGFSFPLASEGDDNHAEWNGIVFQSTNNTPITPPVQIPQENDVYLFRRTQQPTDNYYALYLADPTHPVLQRLATGGPGQTPQAWYIQSLTNQPPTDYNDTQLIGLLQSINLANLTTDGTATGTLGKLDRTPAGGMLDNHS